MTIDDIKKLNRDNLPRFSVFARDKLPMVGDKVRLGEILNKDIVVTDFRVIKSKHREGGECLQLQILVDSRVCIVFSGSGVLIHQIQSAANEIPFAAQITKVDKYFSFA